jgi:hypothetical protein
LRLVVYLRDPSSLRVKLSTKLPRLRSLDLLSPRPSLRFDNRKRLSKVKRRRM